MIYLERAPSPILRPWVRSLWYCRVPGAPSGREKVLPNGCIQIVFNLSRDFLTDCGESGTGYERSAQAIIVGGRGRFGVIETADFEELAGVVIAPGGFTGLFRERADLLFDQTVNLDSLWKDCQLDSVREALCPERKLQRLEKIHVNLHNPNKDRSQVVNHAIHLFRGRRLNVTECAQSIGVSERRLSQVFREEVGMPPKLWCRIRRFQTVAKALHAGADIRWADLALSCGYSDQSHFSHEFRAFSGLDPTTYSVQSRRWQNHIPIV